MNPPTPDIDEGHLEVLRAVCQIADIDVSEFWNICGAAGMHQMVFDIDLHYDVHPCPEYVDIKYVSEVIRAQFTVWLACELGKEYSENNKIDFFSQYRTGIFTWMRHDKTRLYSVYFGSEPSGKQNWWVDFTESPFQNSIKLCETESLKDSIMEIVKTENALAGVTIEDIREIVNGAEHPFSSHHKEGISDTLYRCIFNAGVRRLGRIPSSEELTEIWQK